MKEIMNEASNKGEDAPSSSDTSDAAYGKLQSVGKSTNIAWHYSAIGRDDINKKNCHGSSILWFTGLSGSGMIQEKCEYIKYLNHNE